MKYAIEILKKELVAEQNILERNQNFLHNHVGDYLDENEATNGNLLKNVNESIRSAGIRIPQLEEAIQTLENPVYQL